MVKMAKNRSVLALLILLGGTIATTVVYADLPSGAAATVNGVAIPQSVVDQNIQGNVARGQADTPQLRKVVIDNLINRELLAQNASKEGLDKTAEGRQQLNQVRQNVLAELMLADYQAKNPVTDAQVKAEYDRQIAALGNGPLEQYNISVIGMANEADAKALAASLKKGGSFEKAARDKSTDGSKAQGGALGWVIPSQISPAIASAIAALPKGASITSPVQTPAGWYIVKVDGKRPFKAPSFADSQNQIRNALVQAKFANFINQLKADAKIAP